MAIGIWQYQAAFAPTGFANCVSALYEGNAQILSGTVFKLWYYCNGVGLCYAESSNGTSWTPYSSNPVISSSDAQQFDTVFKVSSTYYATIRPAGGAPVKLYTSLDGITWGLANSSMLPVGTAGQWDEDTYGQVRLIDVVAGTMYASYTGVSSTTAWALGLITSTDGIHWSKGASNPILTTNAPSDAYWTKVNSEYYGWVHGAFPGIMASPTGTTSGIPSDIFRCKGVNVAGPFSLDIPTSVYYRWKSSTVDGAGKSNGQVADPSYVSDGTNLWMFFQQGRAASATIGIAKAANTTFAQLAQTTEGVYDVLMPYPQGTQAFSSPQMNVLVSDSFAAGDSSNWTPYTVTWGGPTFNTGSAQATDLSKNDGAFYSGGSIVWGNDQWASVKMLTNSSSSYTYVTVRSSLGTGGNAGKPNLYALVWGGAALGSAGSFALQKYTNGSYGALYSDTLTVNVGDILTLSVVGTTLSCYLNGNVFYSQTDTTFSSGAPGIAFYAVGAASNSSINEFQAGSFFYSIGGNCGVAGATVSDGTNTTTSDAVGNYILPSETGTVTITPSKTGYTFSPTSASETVNGTDITGVTFGATQTPLTTPTFSPVAGSYGPTQSVSFTSTNATGFFYTTDGTTTPTHTGATPGTNTTYVAAGTPVSVAATETLKVLAYDSTATYADSSVATAAYTINGAVATSTFSPVAGSYGPTQNVSIINSNHTLTGFQIYYNVGDGSQADPTTGSTAYTYGTTIAISATETIKALAVATNYSNSAIGSAAYTINGACGTPTFSPVAGTYTSAQLVTISSATAGVSIYWNTTGSPTSSDTLYAGPITVSASETVYAIAEKAGFSNSAIGSAAYVINLTPAVTVYSVPDCRVAPFGPNTGVTVQGTIQYTGQTSSNPAIPPTDSRAAGAPADARLAANKPQNSRTPGTYGPGE